MTIERPAEIARVEKFFEYALIWYARHFPIARGKLRVIDAAWPRAVACRDPKRTADLVYGKFRAPCDLRDMLQRQLYFFGTYHVERDLLDCWSGFAKSAPIIFDVGANAGIYSLAALAANPRADIFAFEPTPEIADRLRQTKDMNNLRSLHVQQTAVAQHTGEVTLVRCRGELGSNDGMNYILAEQSQGSERVSATSLDSFCAANGIDRIDLMKLDIQGSEPDAIRGAANLLSQRRIGTIFFELNWGAGGAHCPASQSVALLEEHGYRFAKASAQPLWRTPGAWMRSLTDVLAAHSAGLAA